MRYYGNSVHSGKGNKPNTSNYNNHNAKRMDSVLHRQPLAHMSHHSMSRLSAELSQKDSIGLENSHLEASNLGTTNPAFSDLDNYKSVHSHTAPQTFEMPGLSDNDSVFSTQPNKGTGVMSSARENYIKHKSNDSVMKNNNHIPHDQKVYQITNLQNQNSVPSSSQTAPVLDIKLSNNPASGNMNSNNPFSQVENFKSEAEQFAARQAIENLRRESTVQKERLGKRDTFDLDDSPFDRKILKGQAYNSMSSTIDVDTVSRNLKDLEKGAIQHLESVRMSPPKHP